MRTMICAYKLAHYDDWMRDMVQVWTMNYTDLSYKHIGGIIEIWGVKK